MQALPQSEVARRRLSQRELTFAATTAMSPVHPRGRSRERQFALTFSPSGPWGYP